MKRYNSYTEGTEELIIESDSGKYVLYSDIKDDRAMLEEAVYLLSRVGTYTDKPIHDFLNRAKERGIS